MVTCERMWTQLVQTAYINPVIRTMSVMWTLNKVLVFVSWPGCVKAVVYLSICL